MSAPTEFTPGAVFYIRKEVKPGSYWIWKRAERTWYVLRRMPNSYDKHEVIAVCPTRAVARVVKALKEK